MQSHFHSRPSEKKMNNEKRIRTGKTLRDHKSGAHARNTSNKLAREACQKEDPKLKTPFPAHTCNGKRTQALRAANA